MALDQGLFGDRDSNGRRGLIDPSLKLPPLVLDPSLPHPATIAHLHQLQLEMEYDAEESIHGNECSRRTEHHCDSSPEDGTNDSAMEEIHALCVFDDLPALSMNRPRSALTDSLSGALPKRKWGRWRWRQAPVLSEMNVVEAIILSGKGVSPQCVMAPRRGVRGGDAWRCSNCIYDGAPNCCIASTGRIATLADTDTQARRPEDADQVVDYMAVLSLIAQLRRPPGSRRDQSLQARASRIEHAALGIAQAARHWRENMVAQELAQGLGCKQHQRPFRPFIMAPDPDRKPDIGLHNLKIKDGFQDQARHAVRVYNFVKSKLTIKECNQLDNLFKQNKWEWHPSTTRYPTAHKHYREMSSMRPEDRATRVNYIMMWIVAGMNPAYFEFRQQCLSRGTVPSFKLLPDDTDHGDTGVSVESETTPPSSEHVEIDRNENENDGEESDSPPATHNNATTSTRDAYPKLTFDFGCLITTAKNARDLRSKRQADLIEAIKVYIVEKSGSAYETIDLKALDDVSEFRFAQFEACISRLLQEYGSDTDINGQPFGEHSRPGPYPSERALLTSTSATLPPEVPEGAKLEDFQSIKEQVKQLSKDLKLTCTIAEGKKLVDYVDTLDKRLESIEKFFDSPDSNIVGVSKRVAHLEKAVAELQIQNGST
ncbi:hypothetical protein HJFPF1_01292 [Paramyrothecium foliicola]|nr:hypothetical protein HJFPF1_01292 [Paramyrothecium foliicola]